MILRQLFDPASWTYTYLLGDPSSGQAVLIDSVLEQYTRDAALVRELGLTLLYTLETHVHADHVTGAWAHRHGQDSRIVLSRRAHADGADCLVDEGDRIDFGATSLRVRATPGHTDSCVTYVSEDQLLAFTGDALLIRGCGRTDFQQGDPRVLFHSVREKILSLPPACLLYPGHDYAGRSVTSVAEERRHNPRLGHGKAEDDFVGYMNNLGLPHPRQIDVAVPANLRCGRPEGSPAAWPATPSWGPAVRTLAGVWEIDPLWVSEHRLELEFLDVRGPAEFDGELGHIENARLLPLDELRERLDEIPRDRPLITVCRSGARSAQAALLLEKAGIERVANLAGGMVRWSVYGLPHVRATAGAG
ncbi:MAG: MBL fold metallo-hydrolase [Proteobacteria bacterium]|nr:MBL fold metallo-hydrolase [Pseudomonadota bacterium]